MDARGITVSFIFGINTEVRMKTRREFRGIVTALIFSDRGYRYKVNMTTPFVFSSEYDESEIEKV
jgi:hypothetical protein